MQAFMLNGNDESRNYWAKAVPIPGYCKIMIACTMIPQPSLGFDYISEILSPHTKQWFMEALDHIATV